MILPQLLTQDKIGAEPAGPRGVVSPRFKSFGGFNADRDDGTAFRICARGPRSHSRVGLRRAGGADLAFVSGPSGFSRRACMGYLSGSIHGTRTDRSNVNQVPTRAAMDRRFAG